MLWAETARQHGFFADQAEEVKTVKINRIFRLKFRRELFLKSAEGARFPGTETLRLKNSEGTEL